MTVFTESIPHTGGFLITEGQGDISREEVTFATGSLISVGSIVAAIAMGDVTAVAAGGITGNGTLTVDATAPLQPGAQPGEYTVECVTAAANGGTFAVHDPAGDNIGTTRVGVAFSRQVKFLIADGSTDFVVGDTFVVTVEPGSGEFVPLDPTAADGSQHAAGIAWDRYDATGGKCRGVIVARQATVNAAELSWPFGITPEQKVAALADLEARFIIAR